MNSRVLTTLFLAACVIGFSSFRFSDVLVPKVQHIELHALPLVVPTVLYGLEQERFTEVEKQDLDGSLSFKTILKQLEVSWTVRKSVLAKASKQLGSVPVALDEVTLFYGDDGELNYVASPINTHSYLRIDIANQKVEIGDLAGIESEYASTSMFFNGNIDSMLHYTLLASELQEQIRLALTKDMPLDTAFNTGVVKLIYTIKRDQAGAVKGFGGVEALRYRVKQTDRTSIRFVDSDLEVDGFFNPDGSPVQQTWLASPVEGSRVSSPYNLRRLHPILKRIKPHYGTDYAAPYGTPVLAVSDGVVIARRRTRSNGNYIKIRHNRTYQTQYLHLKAFGTGIKSGTQVKKGQVIGYVGATGLADGPHVCFRFWKNGRQIDHRKEDLPSTEELSGEAMITFSKKQQSLERLLDTRA